MAFLDNLTQLANRNYIQKEIQNRFEEMKRYNVPIAILFMDIDYFKDFNDKYGHDVGNIVLRYVAKTLFSNSRPFDLYGRWGGEEFIGVIRKINGKDIENLGNRVRELVANSYIVNNRNQTLQVTVSIRATIVDKDDTIENLIKIADEPLYVNKCGGRNCLTYG